MKNYPKNILNIQQQIQSYINAGMIIPSEDEVRDVLTRIGYYRLRGYSYHLYDNSTKRYAPGTKLTDIVSLYYFDTELSHLIFSYLSEIEVTLRVRLIEALLIYNDALILMDPTVFQDKEKYWSNIGVISSEIARSNDVFIKHNMRKHDGQIPIWASVEVMSFGTVSKIIKNLKTGSDSAFSRLAEHYKYKTKKGKLIKPDIQMFTSWIHSVSILRNICAHNGRIYNRVISTAPELIEIDRIVPQPRFNGLYQVLLAMKYLRPNDNSWTSFVNSYSALISKYSNVVDLKCMNFPSDWQSHFIV